MSVKKKKKKVEKAQVIAFSCLALVGFFLLLLIVFCIVKIFYKKQYEVDSRVQNIVSAREKDEEGVKTVSWIRTQGTKIDYPVVYAPSYDFSYKDGNFAWTEVDYGKLNNIVFVSGHNIMNQSANPIITGENHNRFEQLMSYTYYDFVKENQYIQYTIDGKDYLYKIYAVFYDDSKELDLYNKIFYSNEQMKVYIDDVMSKSIYKFDVDVREDDYMISLVTCTKMFGRSKQSFIVTGRLLRDGEKATLSKVSTTSKYKEVEKQMKGGEVYEEA